VIIDNFHILSTCSRPAEAEADAELVVYADAVLTYPVTLQGFDTVARWNAEVINSTCDLQLPQLAARCTFNLMEALDSAAGGQRFGVRILERYSQSQGY
jgi:hypothetical protein